MSRNLVLRRAIASGTNQPGAGSNPRGPAEHSNRSLVVWASWFAGPIPGPPGNSCLYAWRLLAERLARMVVTYQARARFYHYKQPNNHRHQSIVTILGCPTKPVRLVTAFLADSSESRRAPVVIRRVAKIAE